MGKSVQPHNASQEAGVLINRTWALSPGIVPGYWRLSTACSLGAALPPHPHKRPALAAAVNPALPDSVRLDITEICDHLVFLQACLKNFEYMGVEPPNKKEKVNSHV